MEFKTQLMDAETMRRAYARITHEIAERNPEDFALVGIRTRGVPFAGKIAENTEKFFGKRLLTSAYSTLRSTGTTSLSSRNTR